MSKEIINLPNRKFISVKGAKLHNLKNISVDIPRNKLIVITGVSGSGKSSLAFDTIYAEGQRRFVESLSAYARQFLERMHKPDVDSITGLPPAVAIEQKNPPKNTRSTVGTATEIYDYLRVFYARIGETLCKSCGKQVRKDTPTTAADFAVKNWPDNKMYIMFKPDIQAKNAAEEIIRANESGFNRIVYKDKIIDTNSGEIPKKLSLNDFYFLADRLVARDDQDSISRMTDSIEQAFLMGKGRIIFHNLDTGEYANFSKIYECSECDISYEEPDPKLFSFNHPQGACPHCQGFGRTIDIDEELVIPEPNLTIMKQCVHPFKSPSAAAFQRDLVKVAQRYKIPIDIPYHSLDDEQKLFVWEGSPCGDYTGINGYFKTLEDKNYKVQNRVMISKYRGFTKCKACGGSRLRTSARQVFIKGKNIPDIVNMPLDSLLDFMINLNLSEYQLSIAERLVHEITTRLRLLNEIGLEYLTLSRMSHTLSGGEAQRISLSAALGSSLVGTLYVLDEPSIGMHHRDTEKLINILKKLRNLGNTVIVVEHDPDIIKHADFIIDIGPKAGNFGGNIVFQGKYEELSSAKNSLTALYFTGRAKAGILTSRRKTNGKKITLIEPKENNLKIEKVDFPLNMITVVSGVSGSGKSTLINSILFSGLRRIKSGQSNSSASFKRILGAELIDNVEMVDQSPIGRSSRSTPATFTKVFDHIRELFSHTQAAKQLGLKAGYFSFNVPGGRCEVCEGEGSVTVDMQFLPDVTLECESCHGTRYSREAREMLYKGKSIVDVLKMTIDEASIFFEGIAKITKKLELLKDIGLGYLQLGQPASMLSGGEAQRIKLASHIDSVQNSHTLFIFDEPTTGLHIDDIAKLLKAFQKLVSAGNSIIIIEHNIHVIAAADWVIDLGPEAGNGGGEIVCEGSPEKIAKSKNSYTGKALKEFFDAGNY